MGETSSLSHPALSDFLDVPQLSEYKIGFVTLGEGVDAANRVASFFPVGPLRQLAYQGSLHILLALKVLKMQDYDLIFVMEFHAIHIHAAAILLWFRRRKIRLMMHGVQQLSQKSFYRSLCFFYFKSFKFNVVQFEIADSVLPEQYRIDQERVWILPLPILSAVEPRLLPGERLAPEARIKLGIIGIFREGKPITRLIGHVLSLLQSRFTECELVLGTPRWQDDGRLSDYNIPVVDTTSRLDYFNLLRQVDIVILDFAEEDYYYRPSAAIVDAVSCGCQIVCPNYPVFAHQVEWPVRVGAMFASAEGLGNAIEHAIRQLRTIGQDNHWEYRKSRNTKYLARQINQHLQVSQS